MVDCFFIIPVIYETAATAEVSNDRKYFLWFAPEQKVEQTIEMPVIWDAIALIMTPLNWHGSYFIIFILEDKLVDIGSHSWIQNCPMYILTYGDVAKSSENIHSRLTHWPWEM